MLFTGAPIAAAEAKGIVLVTDVYDDQVLDEAIALASRIAVNAPLSPQARYRPRSLRHHHAAPEADQSV